MNRFIILTASVLSLFLIGCGVSAASKELEQVKTGGVTDRSNYNAPKEIQSRDITAFSSYFYIGERQPGDYKKAGLYQIEIKDNEKGEHVLTVWGVYQHEMVAEDRTLSELQEIIEKYDLVKRNGVDKVTAGLPPEYGPWMLRVSYASGEELYFYEDGNPWAEWTEEVRDCIVKLMADAGVADALPPKEAMTIDRFSFAFDQEGYAHRYGILEVPDEGEYLYHNYWYLNASDDGMNTAAKEEYALISEELYEGLQQVILDYNLESLHTGSVSFQLSPSAEGFLEIYIDYQSGRQIYGEFTASDLPEDWPEMKGALMTFMDAYIQAHRAVPEE